MGRRAGADAGRRHGRAGLDRRGRFEGLAALPRRRAAPEAAREGLHPFKKKGGCSSSPTKMDHGVAVVGYGTDDTGGDYWIVRNSWGPGWGENGYIRLARGVNACGVSNAAVYPISAQLAPADLRM